VTRQRMISGEVSLPLPRILFTDLGLHDDLQAGLMAAQASGLINRGFNVRFRNIIEDLPDVRYKGESRHSKRVARCRRMTRYGPQNWSATLGSEPHAALRTATICASRSDGIKMTSDEQRSSELYPTLRCSFHPTSRHDIGASAAKFLSLPIADASSSW
jgi:hypothetical protein